jgi:hypothetical protein
MFAAASQLVLLVSQDTMIFLYLYDTLYHKYPDNSNLLLRHDRKNNTFVGVADRRPVVVFDTYVLFGRLGKLFTSFRG